MYLNTFGVTQLSSAHLPPRHLLLLAYLAEEGTVSRARLRSVFWPNNPTAAASLRVALSELRRSAPTLIAERGDQLILQGGSDLSDLLAHLQAGRCGEALKLYRGPFLADLPGELFGPELEEWLLETRESLADQLWEALIRSAEQLVGQGQLVQACGHAEAAWQLPALMPRDEHDLRRLHRLLVACGSLQAGRVAREARQLGVELEVNATLERLSPPLKPALPAEVTPFVGQRETLSLLAEWLTDPDIRLLTILGAGGAGKTRLALQTARQLQPNFQGRVWWIALEDLNRPEGLYAQIALSLGTPLSPGMSALESLANVLAERPALIVLDQLEHLSGAEPLIANLLGRYSDLKVLVTSRHRLLLRAEVTFELRGLEVNAATNAAHSDALTLFLQQARRVRPTYRFSETDLLYARELCVLVDGMPLAIELIANWMRMLTPGQMLMELRSNLQLLDLPFQDLPARHRNLRLVLEQSWQLLTERDREVLSALAVFHGGFSVSAASSVTGATLSELEALVDKSMLRVDDTGRFSRHPLIAQFSLHRLQDTPERKVALLGRHIAYFLEQSSQGWYEVLNGHQQLVWRNWFRAESSNLTAALSQAISRTDHVSAAYLCRNIVRNWLNLGAAHAGLETVLELLPHLEAPEQAEVRAWAMMSAEYLAMHCGADLSMIPGDALAVSRQTGNDFAILCALYIREFASQEKGDSGHAALLEEVYEAALHTGRKAPLVLILRRRASVALSGGQGNAAYADLARGIGLGQGLGINYPHADLLLLMGQLQILRGELASAWQSFSAALQIFTTLEFPPEASACLEGLALVCLCRAVPGQREEKLQEALRWCDEADRVFKSQGRYAVRDNVNVRGFVLSALNQLPEAQACLTSDVQSARNCGNHQGELVARLGLGELLLRRHDWDGARIVFAEIVSDASKRGGHVPARWFALHGLAEALKQLGEKRAWHSRLMVARELGKGLGAELPAFLCLSHGP